MIRHRKWGLNINKWNIAEKFLYNCFVRKADLRSYFSDIFIHEVILLVPSCLMKKLIVQQLFFILLSSLNHIKFIDHIQDIDIHFLLLMAFKMKKNLFKVYILTVLTMVWRADRHSSQNVTFATPILLTFPSKGHHFCNKPV